MCYCPTPTLHLNLALTGDGAFLFSLKKTHSVWFISVLNYGDTENVLINHLLLVIPMSYPCHYTNLCPHKPHKHAHTHTHTHTHTHKTIIINPNLKPLRDQPTARIAHRTHSACLSPSAHIFSRNYAFIKIIFISRIPSCVTKAEVGIQGHTGVWV